MKTIALIIAVLALTLSVASVASAQPTSDGYSNQAGQVQAQVSGGGTGGGGGGPAGGQPVAASDPDNGHSLPFTGIDLALLAGAGGVLVATGLTMRRLARGPSSA